MSRTFFLFFALFAAAFLLFGCDAAPPEKTTAFEKPLYRWGGIKGRTVTVWGNRDDLNRPYMKRAFSRYAELTGNTVRAEGFSHRELGERLSAAFAAGGKGGPDILLSFGGANIDHLAVSYTHLQEMGSPVRRGWTARVRRPPLCAG